MTAALAVAMATLVGCGRAVDRGTFEARESSAWPEGALRPTARAPRAHGASRAGKVVILEGDATLVSGIDGALGVRFDEERDDLARVAARFEETAPLDVDTTLVLFTTFDDLGAAGPAYSVPVRTSVEGLGREPLDQRDVFSVEHLVQIVNMKRLDAHAPGSLVPTFAHELAHLHLAYMSARRATSTTTVALTGRQAAHWNAALHTSGSLMGGYGWMETTPGHFLVTAVGERYSMLDLYGLGLADAAEVPPFVFIEDARTEAGFALPAAAELRLNARAVGRRVDLGIEDVVRALGPRTPAREGLRHAVFALLTRPTETATTASVVALARRIDALRGELEEAYADLTLGRGALCTQLEHTPPPAGEPEPDGEAPAPDGDAALPDGDAALPDGDAALPGGDAALPGGEAALPDGAAPAPENGRGRGCACGAPRTGGALALDLALFVLGAGLLLARTRST